jgi:hypothetical protein
MHSTLGANSREVELCELELKDLMFEEGSGLKRIEKRCLYRCSLKHVILPARVWFVAGNVFAQSCEFVLAGTEKCFEFRGWRWWRTKRKGMGVAHNFDRETVPSAPRASAPLPKTPPKRMGDASLAALAVDSAKGRM